LRVVGLVGDHLTDAGDDAPERLAGTPVVADADGMRSDVRMENRRQHPALRRQAWITSRQDDLRQVAGDLFQLVVDEAKTADVVLQLVALGRGPLGTDQLHARMPPQVVLKPVVVGLKSAKANRSHRFSGTVLATGTVRPGGCKSRSVSREIAKLRPWLTRL